MEQPITQVIQPTQAAQKEKKTPTVNNKPIFKIPDIANFNVKFTFEDFIEHNESYTTESVVLALIRVMAFDLSSGHFYVKTEHSLRSTSPLDFGLLAIKGKSSTVLLQELPEKSWDVVRKTSFTLKSTDQHQSTVYSSLGDIVDKNLAKITWKGVTHQTFGYGNVVHKLTCEKRILPVAPLVPFSKITDFKVDEEALEPLIKFFRLSSGGTPVALKTLRYFLASTFEDRTLGRLPLALHVTGERDMMKTLMFIELLSSMLPVNTFATIRDQETLERDPMILERYNVVCIKSTKIDWIHLLPLIKQDHHYFESVGRNVRINAYIIVMNYMPLGGQLSHDPSIMHIDCELADVGVVDYDRIREMVGCYRTRERLYHWIVDHEFTDDFSKILKRSLTFC
jgi:hypothetical protein